MRWRLDQTLQDTTTRRQLEALTRLTRWATPANKEAAKAAASKPAAAVAAATSEQSVRAILLGSATSAMRAQQPAPWATEVRS